MKSSRIFNNYIVMIYALHSSKGLFLLLLALCLNISGSYNVTMCLCVCVCVGENYGLAVRHCQGAH